MVKKNTYKTLLLSTAVLISSLSANAENIAAEKTKTLSNDFYKAVEESKAQHGYYAKNAIEKSIKKDSRPVVSDADTKQEPVLQTIDTIPVNEEDTHESDNTAGTNDSAGKAETEKAKPSLSNLDIKIESYFENAVNGELKGIHKGDEVKLVVRLSWAGEVYALKAEPPSQIDLEGLSVVNRNAILKSSPESGRASAEYHYTLKADEAGKAHVNQVTIPFKIKDSSESSELKTFSMSLDVLPERKNWAKILGIPAVIAASLALILFAFLKIRKTMKENAAKKLAEANMPGPKDQLMSELNAQKIVLVEGDIKTFYDNCFRLLRGYVSLTFGDSTTKKTAMELMSFLETLEMNADIRDRILNILNKCENVRFGGYFPTTSENENVIKDIAEIIQGNAEFKNV